MFFFLFSLSYSVSLDSRLVCGLNTVTLSKSAVKYTIPYGTTIIFIKSKGVEGKAISGSQILNILGSTSIKAIAFDSSAELSLYTASSSSKKCSFIIYNFTSTSICDRPMVFSGSVTLKLLADYSFERYCVFTAFSSGYVRVVPDRIGYKTYNVDSSLEYNTTEEERKITSPIMVYFNGLSYSDGMIIKVSGSSDDEDYYIKDSESTYDFYKFSFLKTASINRGYVGGYEVSYDDGENDVKAIIIAVVVVIVIIGLTVGIGFFIFWVCCYVPTPSSNNYGVEQNQEDQNTTTVVFIERRTVIVSSLAPQQEEQPQQQIPPSYNAPQPQSSPYQQQQPVSSPTYGAPPQYSQSNTKNGFENPYV